MVFPLIVICDLSLPPSLSALPPEIIAHPIFFFNSFFYAEFSDGNCCRGAHPYTGIFFSLTSRIPAHIAFVDFNAVMLFEYPVRTVFAVRLNAVHALQRDITYLCIRITATLHRYNHPSLLTVCRTAPVFARLFAGVAVYAKLRSCYNAFFFITQALSPPPESAHSLQ